MSEYILQTKLAPPQARQEMIPRPQLVARLSDKFIQGDGFSRGLTLFSAPAGYGKTSMVIEWLQNLAMPYGWLSLDEEDNDPLRFLFYLITALQRVTPLVGGRSAGVLASSGSNTAEMALKLLINEICTLENPLILVIDDYHYVESEEIQRQVAYLLDHQPPIFHLVILTRIDPPLPVYRLRAQRQVLEIRQEDLRFSIQEAAALLSRVMDIELALVDIKALNQRTEGWVTGLQLAAISLRDQQDPHRFVASFTGSNRYVLDYLFEEVFRQQTADVQDFLLKTSILRQLTGPLCEALTGCDDGYARLEALERGNLFIVALDAERQWYRYQHLFADLLRHLLHRSWEPSEEQLHIQAAQWYWDHGMYTDAIRHVLRANHWAQAAEWIEATGDLMLKRGESGILLGLIERLPPEVLQSKTRLCLHYAWALMLAGQFTEAEDILACAAKEAQATPLLKGELLSAQAFLAQSKGDIRRMIECSHAALSLLPLDHLTARSNLALNLGIAYFHMGNLSEAEQALSEAQQSAIQSANHYAAVTARIFLTRTLAVRGELRQAAAALQGILAQFEASPIMTIVYLDLCALHYEWNELDEAADYLALGLEGSQWSGNPEFLLAAYLLEARIHLAQADIPAVEQALEQVRAIQEKTANPSLTGVRLASMQVQVAIRQGELASAAQMAQHLRPDVDAHPFYRFLGLSQPQLLIAQRLSHQAAVQLAQAAQLAQDKGWGYGLVAIHALQALSAASSDSAQEHLKKALDMAEPQGYLRLFADLGEALVPGLELAARTGVHPHYCGKILTVINSDHRFRVVTPGGVESLSDRETEVLRLVAAGFSNRQIANQLVVSLGTVKTHLHHIYGKLDVANRAQAIVRAQDLHLI